MSADTALIGLDLLRATWPSLTGDGQTVAIIDTGINYDHPALSTSIWTNPGEIPGNGLDDDGNGYIDDIHGYDFINDNGDPLDLVDGHGTHVTGIIASSDAAYPGVAPGVEIISLKALPTGVELPVSDAIGNALDWVIANRDAFNITAVNLSLRSRLGNFTSVPSLFGLFPDWFTGGEESKLEALDNAGVFVSAAAGNHFFPYGSEQGLSYPAISPHTASVGAVWSTDKGGPYNWDNGATDHTTGQEYLCSFSQRWSGMDLLAPGGEIVSLGLGTDPGDPDTYYDTESGTSMATPFVTGASVLVRQALHDFMGIETTDKDRILQILIDSAEDVVDEAGDPDHDNVTNTGLTFKRLNVHDAIQFIVDQADLTDDLVDGQATIDGSFVAGSQRELYTFQGLGGDLVRIQVTGGSLLDPFDPAVALFSPAQTPQLISSQYQTDDFFRYSEDNPGFFGLWNTDPADIDVLLLEDGQYTIQVQVDPDATGDNREGPYTLSVTKEYRYPKPQQVYLDFSGFTAANVASEFPGLTGNPNDLRDEIISATRDRVVDIFSGYDVSVHTQRPHGHHSEISFVSAWPWPIGPGDDVLAQADQIDYGNVHPNDDAEVYWNHFAPELNYSSASDVGQAFGTTAAHSIGSLVGLRHVDAVQPTEDLMGRLSSRNSLLNSANLGTYDLYEHPSTFFFLSFENLWVHGRQDAPAILAQTLGTAISQPNIDVVEVIDRSGSMGGSRIHDAKEAAKLFVDLLDTGDKIGVVSYSSSASTNFSLSEITSEATKTLAKSAINSLYASGMTSIGAGIRAADYELDRFRSDPVRAMLVMTDGYHNTSPHPIDVINSYVDQDIAIYTVGFGSGANATLLGQIADMRNGQYYFAPAGDQLRGIYRNLAGELTGQQQAHSSSSVIQQGLQIVQNVLVDASSRLAKFIVDWRGSDIDLTLVAPDGTIIDHTAASLYPNISLTVGNTYEVYTIDSPLPGEWQMLVYGADIPVGGETYDLTVTVSSAIGLSMALDKSTYQTGELVHIEATLSDGMPILGASVMATIAPPATALFDEDYVRLYDDGGHGDGAAGDGVYANDFRRLCWSGNYDVSVGAAGISNAGIAFVRTDLQSMAVSTGPDSDDDGMPDVWEDREGTDRSASDADQDPDHDVVWNLHEYYLGTAPLAPDTDADGYSDGTERLAKTNPLNPESIPDPANLATVSGQKFEDLNANGQRDPGEPGLDGWIIELVDTSTGWAVAREVTGTLDVSGDGSIDPQTEQGLYSILYIGPGSYEVHEVPQHAWQQTFPVPFGYNLTLTEGQVVANIDFGNFPQREIHGVKWNDLNGDGIRDAGEPGLEGWTIYLDENDNQRFEPNKEISTTTDANGAYAFVNLAEGTYTVAELVEPGWTQTFPTDQGTHTITLGYAEVITDANFGNRWWEAREPLGSMIRDWYRSGTISSPGDTESITLSVDPGQTITVAVTPDAGLQPMIGLYYAIDDDGDTLAGSVQAAAAGEETVLQTAVTRSRLGGHGPGPSTYVVTVGGAADTVGEYRMHVILNAAAEEEEYGGTGNDTAETAQNMDGSFVPLLRAIDDVDNEEAHPERGAVLGSLPTDGIGGSFNDSQTQYNNVYYPNVLTFTFMGAVPPAGGGTLTLSAIADLNSSSEYLRLEAEGIDLGNVFVTGGLQQSSVTTLVNLTHAQLQTLAADGTITFTVTPSSNVHNLGANELTLELDYPIVSDAHDWYSFMLDAGESATLAVTSLDAGGALLPPPIITTEIEPNDDGAAGGSVNDLPFANDWSGSFVHVGGNDYRAELTGTISAGYDGDWDFFKIMASPGDRLVVAMDGISLSDPYLRLFDNNGNRIASNDDGGPGLNSLLTYNSFAYQGDYYVSADSYSSRTGTYRLTATLTTPHLLVPGRRPAGEVHVELYDAASNRLVVGNTIDTNVDEVIENFVASARGLYYARVFGTGDYSLVVTRNVHFSIEDNDDLLSAENVLTQKVAGQQWVLGHVGTDEPADRSDYYAVELADRSTLKLKTLTPAHRRGELVNELDPMIRVYDSSGVLVASDDNSASDGRNAYLKFRVPQGAAGVYFVEVAASDATSPATDGEYILAIKGADGELPVFEVAATDPADGTRLRAARTEMTVDFDDAVLLTSLDASDLSLDGHPAVGVQVADGNTVIFELPDALTEGWHSVEIPAGAILDIQNTPIEGYTGWFHLDMTPPRVVYSSLQEGDVLLGGNALTYTAQFSEELATGDLDEADFDLSAIDDGVSSSYSPESWGYDPFTSTLTINYSGLPDSAYRLTLFSGDGQFEDITGWNLDGEPLAWPVPSNVSGDGNEGGSFVVNFGLGALASVEPLGSLIYVAPVSGTIGSAGQNNRMLLDLDSNQTITVVVSPDPGLRPAIKLYDPSGSLIGSTVAEPGKDAVLQSVATTLPGEYTITVGGTGGTTGLYTAQVLLNAAVENEEHNGDSNNDRLTAQDIDGSFISLTGSGERGAVLGSIPTAGSGGDFNDSQRQYNNVHYPNVLTFTFTGAVTPAGGGTLTLSAIADLNSSSEYLRLEAEGIDLGNVFVTDGLQQSWVTTTVDLTHAQLATLAADGIITFTVTPSSNVHNLGANELTLELDYPGKAGGLVEVVSEDFETGSLGSEWSTWSSTPYGRFQVTGAYGAASGSYSLLMDRYPSGGNSLNEAVWTVDLSGVNAANLSFFHAEFSDEEDWFTGDFVGHYNADGISISDNGTVWHPIWYAENQSSGIWQQYTINLAAEAASAGMNLSANFQIKFQQYDNYRLTTDGRGYDRIVITTPVASEDWYSFTLDAGESATLVATSLESSGVAPTPMITTETEPNDDGVVGGSVNDLPFANDWSGSFVHVGGNDYQAVLTGSISAGSDVDWDFFKIMASPGDRLVVAMDGISLSDPYLRLFDNAGTQIAYNDDGGPGLNSLLDFNSFTYQGDYYVVADSYSSRTGAYELTAILTTPNLLVSSGPEDQVHMELYDAAGNLLESGNPVNTNVDEVIDNFVAPADGIYYARVFGGGNYSLVVTRNASFDIEDNSLTSPQDLTVSGTALGALTSGVTQVDFEPDDYPTGSDLTNATPGITLTVQGSSLPVTSLVSSYSSTGTHVFGRGGTNYWSAGLAWLRADFADPVFAVSIDVIGNDSHDPGILQAYDANGTLLQEIISPVRPTGQPYTMTITRGTADTAYILASGQWGETVYLDNLVVTRAGDDADCYSVEVNAGDILRIVTSTPADGPYEFVNALDPAIELYDPNGNLVAIDDNGASDGRNALIDYVAGVNGTYTVRVLTAAGEGEYVVGVSGHTGLPLTLLTTSASEAAGFTTAGIQGIDLEDDLEDLLASSELDVLLSVNI